MSMTWEAARYQLTVMSAGVSAFFVIFNLIYTGQRLVWRRPVSSVPLIGTGFGIVALVAVPVSLSWEWVLAILFGFLVSEVLNFLWLWPD